MQILLEYILPVVMIAVAAVIAMGLWNMAKGGTSDRSQRLMRLRIIVQAFAVIIIMGIVYLRA